MNPKRNALSCVIGLAIVTLVCSCGTNSADIAAIVQNQSANGALDERSVVENEIQNAVAQTQTAILGGIFSTLFSGSSNVSFGKCQPALKWSFAGLSLTFGASDSCPLEGNLVLKFFPLGAQVDLMLNNSPVVDSMSFDADIQFSRANRKFQLSWQFLDGKINLKTTKFFNVPQLSLNGTVSTQSGGGQFTLSSRTNVFEPNSLNGIALITKIERDRNTSTRNRSFQGCLVQGADPQDPQLGTLSKCVERSK